MVPSLLDVLFQMKKDILEVMYVVTSIDAQKDDGCLKSLRTKLASRARCFVFQDLLGILVM